MSHVVLVLLLAAAQFGHSNTGELRLTVRDPGGLPVRSTLALVSAANQFAATLETDAEGTAVARRLPFGRYRLEVTCPGFATHTALLDIQSVVPRDHQIVLSLAPLEAQVTVSPDETLLDVRQSSTVNRIGADTLQQRAIALPGRSVSDIVNTQPGWLLEANGVLHPRGSEYQVQFVVDGLPITDNRSASFAPEIDADQVHAMSTLTAGYPAEYGRKLGGVVEVVTGTDARPGLHGSVVAAGGSFGTGGGYAMSQYGWRRSLVGISGSVAHTDRYLDPPVEENFTNSGTGSNVGTRIEHGISDAGRFGVILRRGEVRFFVPNERVQEEAGQRQKRTSTDTAAQFSFQQVFSNHVLGEMRGMFRSLRATLSSNALSTPIVAQQDRGFREAYVKATIAGHAGIHEWKVGIDADFATIDEAFGYQITDPAEFDPHTPATFAFEDRGLDREQALFVQDRVSLGAWTINAGLRFDHYRLLLERSEVSPRLALAWSWPAADLVLRASYDRAFQTPAIENLLLASSPALDSLGDEVVRLPVPPSLGHFYDVGLSTRLFKKVRLDVSYFDRSLADFADDDVLFNTGVSFPMAFQRAHIRGTEVKLELPPSRRLSGYISYGNMTGTGFLPITGGLLVGEDDDAELASTKRFPISQDQRHTARSRISCALSSRTWVALAASYGSGLPVEFVGDQEQAVAQYGQRIVDRVDLEAGRVRPSGSLDASAGVYILKSKKHQLRLQADATNLTNRLNVINFSGLFSGTALAPPRGFAVRVRMEF